MVDMRAMSALWCLHRERYAPRLSCLKCQRYPCSQLGAADLELLEVSPFTTIGEGSEFVPRRVKLYIFKYKNGELKEAPAGFDPDRPDFNELSDVVEVLVISKVLGKQIRLVAKPKEERAVILEKAREEQELQPTAETRKTKKQYSVV